MLRMVALSSWHCISRDHARHAFRQGWLRGFRRDREAKAVIYRMPEILFASQVRSSELRHGQAGTESAPVRRRSNTGMGEAGARRVDDDRPDHGRKDFSTRKPKLK